MSDEAELIASVLHALCHWCVMQQHVASDCCCGDKAESDAMFADRPSGTCDESLDLKDVAPHTCDGASTWQPDMCHLPSSFAAREVCRRGCISFLFQSIGMPLISPGRKSR